MTSGWTRWILEHYAFPFTRLYAPELDAGALNGKYDVLVFVEGGERAAEVVAVARAAAAHSTNQQIFPPNTRGSLVACRLTKRFQNSANS